MQIRDNRRACASSAERLLIFSISCNSCRKFQIFSFRISMFIHGKTRPKFPIEKPLSCSSSYLSKHLNCTLQIDRKDILRPFRRMAIIGAMQRVSVKASRPADTLSKEYGYYYSFTDRLFLSPIGK